MHLEFPYPLLNKSQLTDQINRLAITGQPFLFIISYDKQSAYVIPENELSSDFIQFDISNAQSNSNSKPKVEWELQPIDYEIYKRKFDAVKEEINNGNSFLLNLTQPTQVKTNLTLSEIYTYSKAKYKLWLRNKFVVLSPETFVKIEGQNISCFPMKGTIDASIANAKDLILSDVKEKAEHATIVDLIRNDLSIVASDVCVKQFRYIDYLHTNKGPLLQVSSEISAKLPADYQSKLGTLLMDLLPAGSITGAPKPKTMSIIDQVEGYERGFYTGVFGYFDGKNLDSAVMIRFIEQQGKNKVFKSGGGITSQSNCENEYKELIQKVYVPVS